MPDLELETSGGLRLHATTLPDSPIVAAFHAAYDQAFILPDEKETLAGFRECLRLNGGDAYRRLQQRWGPYREWVAVATMPDTPDTIAGGANLICYPLQCAQGCGTTILLSANLNYIFVSPACRGRGLLRQLLEACALLVRASFDETALVAAGGCHPMPDRPLPLLTFIEQNDPYRLDAEQYARDSRQSGIDQVDRIRIWQNMGARIIDFPYVQPALSSRQQADHSLVLAVIGTEADGIDACVLHKHLERFFAISIMKGRDPMAGEAAIQIDACRTACDSGHRFALLDTHGWLASLGAGPPYRLNGLPGRDLRDHLRAVRPPLS